VGVPGLEPGTSSLSVTRSSQLSYTPKTYKDKKLTSMIANLKIFFNHSDQIQNNVDSYVIASGTKWSAAIL
jgi:hypothetical protein